MNIEAQYSKRLRVALATACLTLVAGLATAGETTTVVTREANPTIYQPYANSGIEYHALARRVEFRDLNLSTPAGTAALRKRVADSASAVCARLGELFPLDYTTDTQCEQEAVKAAMVQVRAAIAKTGKPA